DAPDAKYDPQLKTWEWLNTIQGPNSRLFPLGALGLPIVFKKGIEVAPRVDGKPGRRPSPIWFRPVGTDSNWALLTFAFHSAFLPTDVPVQRSDSPSPPLVVGRSDVLSATHAWFGNGKPHRPTPGAGAVAATAPPRTRTPDG